MNAPMHQCTNARVHQCASAQMHKRLAVCTLAFLCIGAFLHSQSPPPQPTPPTFRTEANYVRVDVLPTKDGAPITDLRLEDFEILENGVPQTIEQFEHVLIQGNVPQESR